MKTNNSQISEEQNGAYPSPFYPVRFYQYLAAAILIALFIIFVAMSRITSVDAQTTYSPLTETLQVGSTGPQVTELQTFLAMDPTIYPSGLVTGYFGPLTQAAVENFQTAHGISVVGIVGPLTRTAINELMQSSPVSTASEAPAPYGVNAQISSNSATFSWYTNESAQGRLYYSTSPLTLTEQTTSTGVPTISGTEVNDSNNSSTNGYGTYHVITIGSLQSGVTYYYATESINSNGEVTISLPSSFVAAAVSTVTTNITTPFGPNNPGPYPLYYYSTTTGMYTPYPSAVSLGSYTPYYYATTTATFQPFNIGTGIYPGTNPTYYAVPSTGYYYPY